MLVSAGAPVWSLGVFGAALTLPSAAGGWVASGIEDRAGFARALGWPAPLSALGLLAAASGRPWLFPAMLLPAFGWNAPYRLLSDYLSRRFPDDKRATTLSISQMAAQVGGILATLTVGFAADRGGREPTLAGTGVVLLATPSPQPGSGGERMTGASRSPRRPRASSRHRRRSSQQPSSALAAQRGAP